MLATLLACGGCKPNASSDDKDRVKVVPLTANELAAIMNTRVWKFVPPRIEGAERTDYELMVSLKGSGPRHLLSIGGTSPGVPLTIALRGEHPIGSDKDEKLSIYLGYDGSNGQTTCENFLRGLGVGWDNNPKIRDDRRIFLLSASKSGAFSPGDMNGDVVLYLQWEEHRKNQ
ncbi:MAG: hypothetical protein ACREKL_00425 [Chthoniobacterales bacterium]